MNNNVTTETHSQKNREHPQSLDFTQWSELARQDADAFEAMRLAAINEFIDSAPEQHRQRLRRLQWRIDQERRLAKSPMGACIRISRMMWESLMGENGLTTHLRSLGRSCRQEQPARRHAYPANVVPIRSDS